MKNIITKFYILKKKLISTINAGLFQDNLEAMADESVKIPCTLDDGGCEFSVTSADEKKGVMKVSSMRDSK